MKKVFALLAIVGVMASCNNKKDDKKKETKDDTAVVTNPTDPAPTDPVVNNSGTPKFADAEVQKYVDDYTAFVTSLVDAYRAKDAAKIADLSGKMSDWSTRSTSVAMKLGNNADEAKKFSDYMTKLSQDMQAAMMPK